MWHSDGTGLASWHGRCGRLALHARGGSLGITVRDNADRAIAAFAPVGPVALPVAAEQFVRGDAVHIAYPERDTTFGLNIVFRLVDDSESRWVLETTVAIQTSLLESHPMIDLAISGSEVRRSATELPSLPGTEPDGGAAGVTEIDQGTGSVAVLLGPRDQPTTCDVSREDELRLRLFGEFLEKGVIRKARPWIVGRPLGRNDRGNELAELWCRLRDSPLPLMS